MNAYPRYAEPFWWWGPAWDSPTPRGIAALLRDETIDSWTAANLWAALSRRRSVAVIAGPSGVGKTTLLTALLEFLPPQTRRIYPRGCFETFAFLSDPKVVATETALLINEISPHLPVYLWGPAVGKMLEAADRGFALLTTAHAGTVQEFVGTLTGSPLRLPAARIAAFEFVVVMETAAENRSGRRVRGVWRLMPTASGVEIGVQPCLPHNIFQKPLDSNTHHQSWFAAEELILRQQTLDALCIERIEELPKPPWPGFSGATPRLP